MLSVTNATDPDSPSLTYNFDVALDPGFTQPVATILGVAAGQGGASWQVPVNLEENTWYYWRAQADDWLIAGSWSATASFFVNTANEAPSTPMIQSPANGATIADLETGIVVTNSMDPDSTVIAYFFEMDTSPTFDSINIVRSGPIAQGRNHTDWHAFGFRENADYYVRVKASDGQADSPWTGTVGFFVNAMNEPPTMPILANPSSGSGVNVFNPSLSVHNASDPDKDALAYDYEVYSDSGLTTLVTSSFGVRSEESGVTAWTVPVLLSENQTYYWRSRAFDGNLASVWMPQASFMVNTANDAPGAPALSAPANASAVATLTPMLAVVNAIDPDSTELTYDFELYLNSTLVASANGVRSLADVGTTSWTVTAPLADNSAYHWRSRAFDGNLYGPWTGMAGFIVHLPQTGIAVELEIEPETLNKKSEGNWIKAEIELPHGFKASDVDLSSIRLEGTVRAEPRPNEMLSRSEEYGCDRDHSRHEHSVLTVKFKRGEVIAVLPSGGLVPVHVSGMVGGASFEGVDVIKVIK